MKRPHGDTEDLVTLDSSGEEGRYERKLKYITMDGLVDDEDEPCTEEATAGGGGGEKKRRLSTEQVRALEKNFEVENKLEPERKVRLAYELGLQPRQVAVWFQNRRARWKTKQLERDYAALQASYDALRFDYDNLIHEKESLISEIEELKAKLPEEERLSFASMEEEKPDAENEAASSVADAAAAAVEVIEEPAATLIYKDGSSVDSDSSAVLNDETRGVGMSALGGYSPFPAVSLTFMMNPDANGSEGGSGWLYEQQQHLSEIDESEFLSAEEPCSSFFSFSADQPPAFSWYYSDRWNLN